MKSTIAVAKCNFATNKLSAFVTIGVIVIQIISNSIVNMIVSGGNSSQISLGNYFYLYLLMLPFFVVLSNYKKFIHLNASKRAYYTGSMLTYGVAAVLVSLGNTLFYTFVDKNFTTYLEYTNLMELTGWMQNGVLIAFLQQAVFLFLTAVFLHVLISLQTYWVGWVVDLAIVIILAVFLPIAPLRHLVASFFALVMFNSNFLLHIVVCLALAGILYMVGLIPLKKRTV